ncbi:hypothetical protein BGZ94_008594 [Podila epigama]|nr:hypothetical protein BGZ94_008594 [Podila epigama]
MITPTVVHSNDPLADGETRGSPHTLPTPLFHPQPSPTSSPRADTKESPSLQSPHTTPRQYYSSNSSPQAGHTALDFIPLPTTSPSAPPTLSPLPHLGQAQVQQHPSPSPPANVARTYPAPYPASSPSSTIPQQQQNHQSTFENVTFVEAEPVDMKSHKLSGGGRKGGSSFLQDVRNPCKKTFWFTHIIVLAIFFGILGATVWRPDNESSTNNPSPVNHDPTRPGSTTTTTPAVNPVPPKPVGITSIVLPKTTDISAVPTQPPAQVDKFACQRTCGDGSTKCKAPCESNPAFQKCINECPDGFCRIDCRTSDSCLEACSDTFHNCMRAC